MTEFPCKLIRKVSGFYFCISGLLFSFQIPKPVFQVILSVSNVEEKHRMRIADQPEQTTCRLDGTIFNEYTLGPFYEPYKS